MKKIISIVLALTCSLTAAFAMVGCDDTPPHEHSFKWVTDKAATATETGLKHEECTCGEKRNENTIINKTEEAHVCNFNVHHIIFPTCVSEGYTEHYCSCGKSEIDTPTDKLSTHIYGPWETITSPSCTKTGQRKRYCTVDGCSHSETQNIPESGHVYGSGVVVEATCSEQGYTEYKCIVDGCNEKIKNNYTPATGLHKFSKTDGKCEVCEKTTFHLDSHDFTENTGYCKNCGQEQASADKAGCSAKFKIQLELHESGEYYVFKGINIPSGHVILPAKHVDGTRIEEIFTNSMWLTQGSMDILEIGKFVKRVSEEAIKAVDRLETIIFPQNSVLEYLSPSSINNCNNLHTIVLPNTIKQLLPNTILQCEKLENVYFRGTIAEWNAIPKAENWVVDATPTIYCTDGIA